MRLLRDLGTVRRLLFGSLGSAASHGERMERFYAGQARDYDQFRERLLPGRKELLAELPLPDGARVLDLGGGTGANLEYLPEADLARVKSWYLVDLAASLLKVAEERIKTRGWQGVHCIEADVTEFRPEEPVDLVLFSYSLTMIPDWPAALSHAENLLVKGGHVAVVDFTVSRKYPPPGLTRHGAFTRGFWPLWFSWDNVFLNPDHLPWLQSRFSTLLLHEGRTALPWLPGSRVPYYYYIGQKN